MGQECSKAFPSKDPWLQEAVQQVNDVKCAMKTLETMQQVYCD